MKYNKITGASIVGVAAIMSAALPVMAAAADSDISVEPPNVTIVDVLTRIRNYFLGFVIIACVFMILWGAFQYTTSSGDEKKVETAKKTIYYAVIGLIVALMAVGIVSLVRGVVEG